MAVGDDVREIKSRLDIADVIGDYVALKKNGQSFWGRCPFHSEKTPSFSVSPERQTFHCFGCGKGGDVFTFVMEMEHLEFREALERLAERAGVKLEEKRLSSFKRSESLRDIQTHALSFFKDSLASKGGEAPRSYLKRRSLTKEDCQRFELGWAPSSWDALLNNLKNCGYDISTIIESGLVSQGSKGYYDRFRGRIMFPIYSITDRLIGFGGRILDGDEAKYLNSPESALFNKRNNLYLLNKAKMSVREKNSVILVEGYMDAIRAHISGFTNTVASLGTALTDSQAALIKRMTGLCYICYDSDSAGREAALKGMYVLQRQGVAVKIVTLSGGKDPDEILLGGGGQKIFQKALDEALPLPVYHALSRAADIENPEKSHFALDELFDGLASLSQFDVMPHLDRVAQILGMFRHDVEAEIESRQEKVRGKESKRLPEDDFIIPGNLPEDDDCDAPDELECLFCSMLWGSADLRSGFTMESVVPYINSIRVHNIVSALLSGESPSQLENRWRQMGDTGALNIIAKGNGILSKEGIAADAAAKILNTLKKRCIENKVAALKIKLKKGTATESEIEEHLNLTRILKGGNFGG